MYVWKSGNTFSLAYSNFQKRILSLQEVFKSLVKMSARTLRQQRRWANQENAELQKEQQEYRESEEREYMDMRETIARMTFTGWQKDKEIKNLKLEIDDLYKDMDEMREEFLKEQKELKKQLELLIADILALSQQNQQLIAYISQEENRKLTKINEVTQT